jgi:hypothetical protein
MRVRAAIRGRPDTAASTATHVMENLTAFQADPCSSTWYGFVVRLSLLVDASAVSAVLGELDPFPAVTALALADVRLAQGATPERAAE